jgi:hypothetical protein
VAAPVPTGFGGRRILRAALAGIAALLVLSIVVAVPMVGYALLSPFTGVLVPASCAGGTAGPSPRLVEVPGHGEGTAIAADGPATVVAVPAPDGHTAGGSVHLLAGDEVVFSLPVTTRAVAAGVGDGRAYVFDDKIGYVLAAATGAVVPRTLTIDNYRGLYTAGGVEHVQTSLEIAIVGSADRPFLAHGLPFGAVVDGCLVASTGAG